MKTSLLHLSRAIKYFVALAVTLAAVEYAEGASRWATLEAIHKLENPHNLTRPGAHGELGAYQFRVTTWRMHTSTPFVQAIDRETSDYVAVRHYEWLRRGLESARLPASPYNIALAWNSGLAAVVAGKSPRIAHDYARRAVNLAAEFDRATRQLAADTRSSVAGGQ